MSASMAGSTQREKSSYLTQLRDPGCEDFSLGALLLDHLAGN
jgi:hypothetical protein